MVPNDSGGYERIEMTDEETIALLESRGLLWKRDGEGHPVAVDFGSRRERRRAQFGSTWRENT